MDVPIINDNGCTGDGSTGKVTTLLGKKKTTTTTTTTSAVLSVSASLLAAGLYYERRLQHKLTRPPVVMGQLPQGTQIRQIYDILSSSPESILRRPIVPSFLIGTRAQISSTAAYMRGGTRSDDTRFVRFREVLTMTMDGAHIGIDWEVPLSSSSSSSSEKRAYRQRVDPSAAAARKLEIKNGPIEQPVILILHGINNHSRFGYIQSLQRECSSRGWNACAMNFRGCGSVPMTTPRGYHAAYTGDLRSVVQQISSRMADGVPMFLAGNSLGANVVTKYLGEDSMAGTLPACVAGGISLGNPLMFYSENITFPFNVGMAIARKATYLEHRHTMKGMNDLAFRTAKRKGLLSTTLGQLDAAAAPLMIRNDTYPPFGIRIGYESGQEYWSDSGCYKVMRFISVPFLMVSAEDDFLCYKSTQRYLGHALSNPNIMLVETRTGGHLGWQESNPRKNHTLLFDSSSWSDVASADFIDATLKTRKVRRHNVEQNTADIHTWFRSRL